MNPAQTPNHTPDAMPDTAPEAPDAVRVTDTEFQRVASSSTKAVRSPQPQPQVQVLQFDDVV
ncbi:MAG: hypothetical protein Q8K50_05170, partial [Hydrogenophaga sp.]|nr:hypothetical protein [Hydrogenophaga sp.]